MSDINDDLEVRKELLGAAALNPFARYGSSARATMFLGMVGQALSMIYAEKSLVQSGYEAVLSMSSFSKVMEHDSKILSIVPRYRDAYNQDYVRELVVCYQELDSEKIEIMIIPRMDSNHQYFSYEYDWENIDLQVGDLIPAGTKVARVTTDEDDSVSYGVNLNVALVSEAIVAEDSGLVYQNGIDKMHFHIYDTRTFVTNDKNKPGHLYGPGKIIPDIGEKVHDSGALAFTRKSVPWLDHVLFTKKAHSEYDEDFDDVLFARDNTGVVSDIKVMKAPPKKKEMFHGNLFEQLDRYADRQKDYYLDIINVYENLCKDPTVSTKSENIGPIFQRELVEAYHMTYSKNTNLVKKKENIPMYTVEVKIRHRMVPNKGGKLTGKHGDKVTIGDIRPSEEAPYDRQGRKVDIILDYASTIGRTIVSRNYESYFGACSLSVKREVENMDKQGCSINEIFDYVLGFLKIIDNEQFEIYSTADIEDKEDIVDEIIMEEFYIYYNVEEKKKRAWQIVPEIAESKYAPIKDKIMIYSEENGWEETKHPVFIGNSYFLLLSKIADESSVCPSASVNHFGVPTGPSNSNKFSKPYNNSPIRFTGETEGRLLGSYVAPYALAELNNRKNSLITHDLINRRLLTAKEPTNIDVLINRKELGFKDEVPSNIFKAMYRTSGVDIAWSKK